MSKRRVAYYYDNDIGAYSYGYGHFMKPHRMRVTHELISVYEMLPNMHVLRPKRATPGDMTAFHTDEYIDFLHKVTPETAQELTLGGARFLVGEDNPPFEGVFEFCSISAGGSLSAASRLASGSSDITINWSGGLHHAKKSEAAGFCYINDIVLCILELLRTYPRVLYIDVDAHHGDGVEEAFYTTDRVMTCSFHKFGDFFPGTGTQEDKGRGKGRGYSVNVPLKDGIGDETFRELFDPVVSKILEVYRPSVVILQCGADSLAGDKLGSYNLTMRGHAHCVQFLRRKNVPLILLGGGGYTVKNVAKAWTYETACALGIEDDIDETLPWNEYFEWFGPRYRLEVLEGNRDDENLENLDQLRSTALQQLSEIQPVPSVPLHDVPRQSLAEHFKLPDVRADEPMDDLDERIAEQTRQFYAINQDSTTPSSSDAEDDIDWDTDDSARHRDRRAGSNRIQRSSRQTSRANTHAKRLKAKSASRSENPKQRMSILTSQYFDVPDPCGFDELMMYPFDGRYNSNGKAMPKRKFFKSEVGIKWSVLPGEGYTIRSVLNASIVPTPMPREKQGVVGNGTPVVNGGRSTRGGGLKTSGLTTRRSSAVDIEEDVEMDVDAEEEKEDEEDEEDMDEA